MIKLLRTDAFPGQRLEGKVREITPMGDIAAKTYRVKMALPDDTPLKPGMSVTVQIKTGSRRVIEYVLSPLLQHVRESLHER